MLGRTDGTLLKQCQGNLVWRLVLWQCMNLRSILASSIRACHYVAVQLAYSD
jgi:hypothetical protein